MFNRYNAPTKYGGGGWWIVTFVANHPMSTHTSKLGWTLVCLRFELNVQPYYSPTKYWRGWWIVRFVAIHPMCNNFSNLARTVVLVFYLWINSASFLRSWIIFSSFLQKDIGCIDDLKIYMTASQGSTLTNFSWWPEGPPAFKIYWSSRISTGPSTCHK